MPLSRSNEPPSPIVTEDDPVVLEVEIGRAVLNTVSHHGYLRCAKYVNPLVRQLSNHEESVVVSPTAVYNRNSLIILDADVVEVDTELGELEHDVYEEQFDSELETSLHNGFKVDIGDDSDSTLSGNIEDDDDSIVNVHINDNILPEDINELNPVTDNQSDKQEQRHTISETSFTSDLPVISISHSGELDTDASLSLLDIAPLQNTSDGNIDNLSGTLDQETESDEVNITDLSKDGYSIDKSAAKDTKITNTDQANMDLLGEIESELEMLRSHSENSTTAVDEDNELVSVETTNVVDRFDDAGNINAHQFVTLGDMKQTETVTDNVVLSNDSIEINNNNDEEIGRKLSEVTEHFSEDTKGDEGIESEDLDSEDEDTVAVTKETEQVVETSNSNPDENALKVNGASEISENGISEEDAVRDPDVFRETHQKEEIHFAEMNNVRQKFESGQTSSEEQTPKRVSVKEEYDQGGEFENEPVRNPDVVREADQPSEELPEIGMAKNLVSRFKTISEEQSKPAQARPASPPRTAEKAEYESQPAEHLPQYEAKVESGVFESEPKNNEDVVRSGDHTEDYKPEQGSAKNILNRFKEIETESGKVKSSQKRELTPDKSGKVEYVSEPRGEKIEYNEAKSESGVFENVPTSEEDVVKSGDRASEVLPEAGFAKSVLSKFKQMETEVGNKPPPSPKRDLIGDKSGKSEFVSEPRGFLERYEPQTESGEYENQPAERGEVVRSGETTEEVLPEAGTAKKTMERFKEIQKQSSSPVSSSRSKAMTPPRESSPGRTVGVVENQPVAREDVVRSGEAVPELLPEQGSTRNMLNKFKEIQTSGSQSSSPNRKPKEFTPPPESGVYENTPKEHLVVETRQSESGVLENTPSKSVADVAREREATPETEMPEQGYAKNMVSKWKQLESSSGSAKSTSSTSPRFKQVTPPRDSRGPLSPKSPIGVTNGVHPSELPGQYQPQESSVIVENNPEVKEGIYREADTDWTAGMPAPNTTSSMLQKFKQIQSKAKDDETSQAPVTKKDESPPPQDIEVITSHPNMAV